MRLRRRAGRRRAQHRAATPPWRARPRIFRGGAPFPCPIPYPLVFEPY
ncbi:hypothetical protein MYA_4426 [Burkholderia sp. KJ006]|nr:hypothetical protein MYA_4426 [Burkholderia sp. KJ006]